MVRRKLVIYGGNPYWSETKEKESTGKKIKKGVMKGLVGIGKAAVGFGKAAGKEIGKAADNYAANQRMQQQQKPKKDEEKKPQNSGSMFPQSGFGF